MSSNDLSKFYTTCWTLNNHMFIRFGKYFLGTNKTSSFYLSCKLCFYSGLAKDQSGKDKLADKFIKFPYY